MAKLTARFDMVDQITKKMKAMQGKLESVEKNRKKLQKPMVLKAKDEATKKLQSISRSLKKGLPKQRSINVVIGDHATKPINKMSDLMRRKVPKKHAMTIEAVDKTKSVREKISQYFNRHYAKAKVITITAKDKAMEKMRNIASYGQRQLSKGYNFTVRAIDIASKTVGRIAALAKSSIPKFRDFTIRAIDGASRVVGTIKRALFSIPTLLTVTLAVVGVNKLGDATFGAAMNFEDYSVSMDHWLKGNKKASAELMDWMGKKADKTPFSSPDIFPAMTGAVALAGKNMKEVKRLTSAAIDMASLTPGKTVEEAMQAIQNANMGELTMMKSFGMKISKKEMDEMGWGGFLKEVEKNFKGGAEKLSGTARGIIATLQGYRGSLFRSMGQGFLEPMKPRLQAISNWLDNNQDKWGQWKGTVSQAAKQASEWLFTKLEKGFKHIRIGYLENDEFKKLDFVGKIKFILSDLDEMWREFGKPTLDKWWNSTGQSWTAQIGISTGKAIFTGIVAGAKEGLKSLGEMWINAFKDPSLSSVGGAAVATAVVGAIATMIFSPLTKGFKALSTAGKWLGKFSKKASGLFNGQNAQALGFVSSPFSRKVATAQNGPSPVYTQPWFNKGSKVKLNVPNAKEMSKFSKFLSGTGKLARKVPVLGAALGALHIAAAPKGEKAGAVGSVGGGLAGAAAGAAIGSVVPGIGTAIGGVLGGVLGSLGGGYLGDNFKAIVQKISDTLFNKKWWKGKWDSVKGWTTEKLNKSKDWFEGVKQKASKTLFSKAWWGGKWDSVKSWSSSKLSKTRDWWNGITKSASETIFNKVWWSGKWDSVRTWTKNKLSKTKDWWDGVTKSAKETIFNKTWWGNHWEKVSTWSSDKLAKADAWWKEVQTSASKTLFNKEWWRTKWSAVVEWSGQKWSNTKDWWEKVKTSASETLFNPEWWGEKWDSVKEKSTNTMFDPEWWSAKGANIRTTLDETLFDQDWWSSKWESIKTLTEDSLSNTESWWEVAKLSASTHFFNEEWWAARAGYIVGIIEATLFNKEWWRTEWGNVRTTSEDTMFDPNWWTLRVEGIKALLNITLFNKEWWNTKYTTLKTIASLTILNTEWWGTLWGLVLDETDRTLFNPIWWGTEGAKSVMWVQEKWENAGYAWKGARFVIGETLFNKEWWTEQWTKVVSWGVKKLLSIKTLFEEKFSSIGESFNKGRTKGKEKVDEVQKGNKYANGGYINRPHLGLVGEAGPEMIIPLSASRRARAMDLYNQTGQMLGVRAYANGGLVGGSVKTPNSQPVQASVNVGSISVQGMDTEAKQYGESFSSAVASGINNKVVPISSWKQNNIENPMQGVIKEAVGFGSSTVTSFSAGQNSTPTGTRAYLQNQVHNPFSGTVSKGSPWGIGLVRNFISGVRSMSGAATGAVTALGNKMISSLSKALNGMTSGVNFVLGKIGVDSKIPTWNPPKYARGTNYHPGGPAIVGDGGGPELMRYPNGNMSLSPGRDTLVNLPRGTEVLPHHKTQRLMGQGVPAYKDGIGFDDIGGKFQNKLGDIFEYMGDPAELVDDVIKVVGVQLPNIGGAFGDMSRGAFNLVKNKMVEWISSKFSEFGGMDTFGGLTRTSGYGLRSNPFGGIAEFHKGIDFAGPLGTPIKANVGGNVVQAGYGSSGSGYGGYGNVVAISSGLYTHLYGHLQKVLTKVGQSIAAGQVIGLLGSTGQSTGPHLHYEVRKSGTMQTVDPEQFLGGGTGAGFGGVAASGSVRKWIMSAMSLTGTPMSWLPALTTIAMKESNGNPRTINLWDSNAKRGIPSKGLMQTIDPTFNAYKMKGMNDIWNPVHNAIAAIRYIKARYGTVFNTPGIRSMSRNGPYKGYAKGGKVPSTQWAWVGEEGPELMRLPGGAEIFPHEKSKRMSSDQMSAAFGSSGSSRSTSGKIRDIVIQITGDNYFNNDTDLDNFTNKVKRALEEVLKDEYNEGGELVVYD